MEPRQSHALRWVVILLVSLALLPLVGMMAMMGLSGMGMTVAI